MKVEKGEKSFQKVILTIESQEELNWLYALSNTSVTEAKNHAIQMGFTLSGDASKPQMALYNALSNIHKGE